MSLWLSLCSRTTCLARAVAIADPKISYIRYLSWSLVVVDLSKTSLRCSIFRSFRVSCLHLSVHQVRVKTHPLSSDHFIFPSSISSPQPWHLKVESRGGIYPYITGAFRLCRAPPWPGGTDLAVTIVDNLSLYQGFSVDRCQSRKGRLHKGKKFCTVVVKTRCLKIPETGATAVD